MRKIYIILGLLCIAYATETFSDYHYCDSSDKYNIYINSAEVNPYPIETGVDAAFNFHV